MVTADAPKLTLEGRSLRDDRGIALIGVSYVLAHEEAAALADYANVSMDACREFDLEALRRGAVRKLVMAANRILPCLPHCVELRAAREIREAVDELLGR